MSEMQKMGITELVAEIRCLKNHPNFKISDAVIVYGPCVC